MWSIRGNLHLHWLCGCTSVWCENYPRAVVCLLNRCPGSNEGFGALLNGTSARDWTSYPLVSNPNQLASTAPTYDKYWTLFYDIVIFCQTVHKSHQAAFFFASVKSKNQQLGSTLEIRYLMAAFQVLWHAVYAIGPICINSHELLEKCMVSIEPLKIFSLILLIRLKQILHSTQRAPMCIHPEASAVSLLLSNLWLSSSHPCWHKEDTWAGHSGSQLGWVSAALAVVEPLVMRGVGVGVGVNVRFTLLATFQITFKGKRGRKLTVRVGQKRNPRGLTHKENIHTQVRSLGKWFNCNKIWPLS